MLSAGLPLDPPSWFRNGPCFSIGKTGTAYMSGDVGLRPSVTSPNVVAAISQLWMI